MTSRCCRRWRPASPDILLWSFSADDWACDSAFVAAHNAAIEISTCGPVGGYPWSTWRKKR